MPVLLSENIRNSWSVRFKFELQDVDHHSLAVASQNTEYNMTLQDELVLKKGNVSGSVPTYASNTEVQGTTGSFFLNFL